MLMMSRREGETILIGDEIEVVIAHIGRNRVRVGIRAPREMPVVAREVKLVREENLAAAHRSEEALAHLIARFQPPVQVPAIGSDEGDNRQDAGNQTERISPCPSPFKPT